MLTLHPMKEIRIVVEGEHLKLVTNLLDRVGATGYTIINNVSGKGHHGFHEGHLLFDDTSSQVIIFTVVPEERIEPILAGLGPLFHKHSGAMFVSEGQEPVSVRLHRLQCEIRIQVKPEECADRESDRCGEDNFAEACPIR